MAAPTVSEWNGWGLANAEFLDYSKEIARVATAFNTEKIPVASALAELKSLNTTLVDFINESRTSDKTATIAALDSKRDGLFHALYAAAEYVANCGDSTGIYAHAAHLANVLSAYKGLAAHSLTKETQEIDGLQFDLEKTASVNALKETGLYKIAGQLFEVNTAFKQAYYGRTDEESRRDASRGGETTTSLRKKAAAIVVQIIHVVNALNSISSDSDTATAAENLAGIVKRYKLVAATAHGKKKGSDPSPDPSPAPDAAFGSAKTAATP